MQQFLESIELSVEHKNWYGALFMALAMPDICRSVERPVIAKGETGRWYRDWFDRYLSQTYSQGRFEETKFHAQDCWLFRCSCLHAGMDAENRRRMMKFRFTPPPEGYGICVHKNHINGTLQLQIDIFCQDVINAVRTWMREVDGDHDVQSRMEMLLKINQEPLNGLVRFNVQ